LLCDTNQDNELANQIAEDVKGSDDWRYNNHLSGRFAKVSRGATALNEVWRLAA
jgi:hypothetical protein